MPNGDIDYDLLRRELALPEVRPTTISRPRRTGSILEAKTWQRGVDKDHQVFTCVSPDYHGYQVVLGKPGKEAELDPPNENDMTPRVSKHGELIPGTPSFNDIWDEFQTIEERVREDVLRQLPLEVLACLLFRSAFMLDHQQVPGNGWRLRLPPASMELVNAQIPPMLSLQIPPVTFLFLVDALALNEDAKYNPNPDDSLRARGRQNTLLTCVHIIGVILGRVRISFFCSRLSNGRGVAPISQGNAKVIFDLLNPAFL